MAGFLAKLFGSQPDEKQVVRQQQQQQLADRCCPYCGTVFDSVPTRKRKCPSCGKAVLVKSRFPDRRKVLVTEEQAQSIAHEWADYHQDNKLARRLQTYGVTDSEKRQVEIELTERFGQAPSRADLAWGAANLKTEQAMRKHDLEALSHLYWFMSRQLFEEGRDYFAVAQDSERCYLQYLRNMGFAKVKVIGANDDFVCPACAAVQGKVFTIQQALKTMPIPVKECTSGADGDHKKTGRRSGLCRCSYVAVGELSE